MTGDIGKREAHKIATRHAIQASADALFASRGYADTTVRDIADAAGITERTFFRYFAGKEALLVKDIEALLPVLADAIRRRPAAEPPLDAVRNAVLELGKQLPDANSLSWLFHDGPPGPKLEKSTPGLLLRFEQLIADAIADRLPGTPDPRFRSEVLARCAVGALRSAGIRRWYLDDEDVPSREELITQAFDILRYG
ncbi:hypothetical protein BVC93_01095 [Mycobacterium sp. MS1601]|uniref:TetR family transcriptional regulator n=1 Tax=Mycobacterium sp. MS1601 TaxID=1936029 RepID=UPI0009793AFE|nr:TetR family transcriptional regulator [Mycobacterium sp. MS1601]AQA01249.1 hypothetical protein BVC93_01095 [Mycobacterium sp. MS1601]